MGVSINFTKGSGKAHLNKRLSKQQLAERREKQQLAQHKIEEAVRRARRSAAVTETTPLSPTRRGTSTAAVVTATTHSRQWAFSHARKEGDRRMNAAVTYRPSSTTAYAPVPPEKLEKKKYQLLATSDWSGLSRSNSPRSRSATVIDANDSIYKTPQVKGGSYSTAQRKSVTPNKPEQRLIVKVEAKVPIDVKIPKVEEQDSSLTDIYMSSSPPKHDTPLSSSIQSNFSSSSRHEDTLSSIQGSAEAVTAYQKEPTTPKPEEDEVKPSSSMLTEILSSQASVATYAPSTVKSVKGLEEVIPAKTMPQAEDVKPSFKELRDSVSSHSSIATRATLLTETIKQEGPISHASTMGDMKPSIIKAGFLRYLGHPYTAMRHVRELDCSPLLLNCFLPCMSGDCNPPFVYDGISRSSDFLGMAFAGPDMDV
ncbi:hypothetical protein P389DRAFT_187480 [Cystobasidium minutum MCA 4210]|uniref:uncharacterized protein n=1 Tax=Cystobasidium minutum MCA 4210 TaxID=1397322 RepID=UPI0034CFFE9D|eukprot:jgi/Rhomi1/187480/estExt_fgenesh1_pg.C_1_t20303